MFPQGTDRSTLDKFRETATSDRPAVDYNFVMNIMGFFPLVFLRIMDQLLGFTKHDILKPPQEIQLKSADASVNGKYTIKKSSAEYSQTIPQVLLNANLCSADIYTTTYKRGTDL